MSKKTERRGNLKYSLLLLLLLAVLLVSSTYAWFTANEVVSISTIDVNVIASNGLQISADASNWKAILQVEDITGAGATYTTNKNQMPETLEPVSTAGVVTNHYLDMYYGQAVVAQAGDNLGEYVLQATKENAEVEGTEGKYIAFDVFLRVDQPEDIVLSTDSNVVFTEGTTDRGIQNAARVAFLDKGTVAPGSTSAQAQALDEGETADLVIWEPNNDVHTAAAVQNANDTYGITTQQTGAAQIEYDGIKDAIAGEDVLLGEADATHFADYFADVDPQISTQQTMANAEQLIHLEAGITKLRIYMWVEGQDVDCENQASGSDMSFNLKFEIAEEP